MPPPKPSTEGHRDRQVAHEMAQIMRALHAKGPQHPTALADTLGAEYWDADRFDRALALNVADGRVVRLADGRVQAV
jgi:hypothetical protein